MKPYPRYKCCQCGQVWNAPASGPTSCPHCGHIYVAWMNYATSDPRDKRRRQTMPMIEVTLEDDVVGEKEYTIAFVMTASPTQETDMQPAEGAEFEVRFVWDAKSKKVKGGEFDAVAEKVLDCYYDEMLEAAGETW